MMEEERARRIANETPEQREARILEEKRLEKQKKDKEKQRLLASTSIYTALNKLLTEFANDHTQFDSADEIVAYLDEATALFDRYVSDKEKMGKYRLIERVELALMRFRSTLRMLANIDQANPMYGEFEDRYERYTKHLEEVMQSEADFKKIIFKVRIAAGIMLAISILLISLFEDENEGLYSTGMLLFMVSIGWGVFDYIKIVNRDKEWGPSGWQDKE